MNWATNIPLNLKDSIDDVLVPGDASIVNRMKTIIDERGRKVSSGEVDYLQLIICCPHCGEVSSSAGSHKYDKTTKSYHPSIVHDVKLGGCGWHGWLKNGIFTKV